VDLQTEEERKKEENEQVGKRKYWRKKEREGA
jgi:hypothetical protein